eukprot:gene17269-22803_t
MKLLLVLILSLILSLINGLEFLESTKNSFDIKQANISLWLSTAAYCGKDNIESHEFKGPTEGFVVTDVISNIKTDTQGYIGYLPSDKSIYVVFRGSESTRNWITNLDAYKTNYTSFPSCNCEVHKGFYDAEQSVISSVITQVKLLKIQHIGYSVKVTGHSLGAALAQLTAMDLISAGISTSVYNFGQPRVGDKSYADFSSNLLTTWRVVHNADMVPHVPVTLVMDYVHACTEQFEDVYGDLKTCDSSCEDPTCSDQYSLKETTIDDHLIYLGLPVSCSSV